MYALGTVRITKDVELVNLNNGNQVINLSVAENITYKNKEGERVESVIYHDLKEYRKEFSNQFLDLLKKGNLISVRGPLRYDEYEKEGNKFKRAYIQIESLKIEASPNASNE